METCIVKYGGSFLISKESYNVAALEELAEIVLAHTNKQFIFIIGGGKLCRNITSVATPLLEKALNNNTKQLNIAFDELGIATTKINARYVISWLTKKLGDDIVYEKIVDYPKSAPKTSKRVIIASGYHPGVSTDYDMVLLAKTFNASKAFKISNFDVVLDVKSLEFNKDNLSLYTSLPLMSWTKMKELVGDTFIAGGNYPLDPPSTILGLEILKQNPDFTLYIGQKSELSKMIAGTDFIGTVVRGI